MKLASKTILPLYISAASVMAVFITPELSVLQQLFKITNGQLSILMTIYLSGYLIGQFFFAYLSKKIGLANSIRLGLLISAIGIFLQNFLVDESSFKFFIFCRFITAFGLASGLVCGFTIIKLSIQGKEAKKYLSIIGIIFTASIYMSIFISGIIFNNFGIAFVFKLAFMYIFFLLLFSHYLDEPSIYFNKRLNKKINIISPKNSNFFELRLICYSLILSITTIIAYCYAFYAPLITFSFYGLSPSEFSKLNLINMFAIFIGSVSYPQVNKTYKDDSILLMSLSAVLLFGGVFFIMNFLQLFNNIVFFFFISGILNFFSGLIYPVATYKALECGFCKTNTSATMNVIKLGMPTVALYFSTVFHRNSLLSLSIVIGSFSFLYLMFFLCTHLKFKTILT